MTTSEQLLRTLTDQGASLQADGDELVIDAPPGTLTPQLLTKLREHKGELLKTLSALCPVCGAALQITTDNERYRSEQCSRDVTDYSRIVNKRSGQPMGVIGYSPEGVCGGCGAVRPIYGGGYCAGCLPQLEI